MLPQTIDESTTILGATETLKTLQKACLEHAKRGIIGRKRKKKIVKIDINDPQFEALLPYLSKVIGESSGVRSTDLENLQEKSHDLDL